MAYQSNPFGSGGSGGSAVARDDAQQHYNALQQDVTVAVQTFSRNTNSLTKLVQSIGTKRDTPDLRAKVHALIQQNKLLARDTSQKLKRLSEIKTTDANEQRQRRVVQSRLAQDFQTWGAKFQEISTLDLNKERKDVRDNVAQPAFTDDGSGDRFYRGGGDDDLDAAARRSQEQASVRLLQSETDLNEQIMRERNAEIREVETAVVEVGQIFQDLATMVNEQGLMVDNIESNISDSVAAVDEGVKHLESADEYQQKARKRCLILSIIITVVVAVLVVVLLKVLHVF